MTNIFLSFLGISVSISFMILLLLLLTPFLSKRYAAKWKYLIWIFLALRLLIPFSGARGQFVLDLVSQRGDRTVSQSREKSTETKADERKLPGRIIVEIPAQMAEPIQVQSPKNHTSITALDIVAFIWMIGSLIFLSAHIISYSHYKRQVIKKGKVLGGTVILGQMFILKRELHIRRTIQVIEYHEAESPMLIGFLKPALVLPKEQYTSEELFFILKHELVHFKRGDVYLKLLFVTANAIHWFNPFIWLMQKEAVIDMELSCDERVTKGTSYAQRKAYTETLLSMLHKGCARKTLLSTQFYGGTKIMKRRFKNILTKNKKKNGIFVLTWASFLTISFGALVGCSIAKEDIDNKDAEKVSDQSGKDGWQGGEIPVDSFSSDNYFLENTTMLTFSKEGEQEQKQASLAIGDGYSIFLPDDEWLQSDADTWTASVNQQVRLWIAHFENETMDSAALELGEDGYETVQEGHMQKREGDLAYHVTLKEFENHIWGIFYCYPADSEEGWGRELPVIADTFALWSGDDSEKSTGSADESEVLAAEDCAEITNIVKEFASAYFDGNIDVVKKFLASTYEGDIDTYESTGTISDLKVKGLSDADEKRIENGRCVASLEFRDSNYEDMLQYLGFVFVKQEDSWKIQFYGVEG